MDGVTLTKAPKPLSKREKHAAQAIKHMWVACTTPMAEWSVGDVASWLAGLDMAGPAAMLSAQGLSGADLLSFESASAFAHDLGTTPFVASKVLRLRDQHRV